MIRSDNSAYSGNNAAASYRWTCRAIVAHYGTDPTAVTAAAAAAAGVMALWLVHR